AGTPGTSDGAGGCPTGGAAAPTNGSAGAVNGAANGATGVVTDCASLGAVGASGAGVAALPPPFSATAAGRVVLRRARPAGRPGGAAGGGAPFWLGSGGGRGRGGGVGRGGGRVGGGRGRCAGLRIGRRRRPGSRLSSPPPGGAGAWRRLTGGCVAYAGRAFAAWPVTAGLCVV